MIFADLYGFDRAYVVRVEFSQGEEAVLGYTSLALGSSLVTMHIERWPADQATAIVWFAVQDFGRVNRGEVWGGLASGLASRFQSVGHLVQSELQAKYLPVAVRHVVMG